MSLKLLNFQSRAVEDMISATDTLLTTKENRLLLEAITGAGKTVIAIDYIEKVLEKYENICFIWISIGKGNLHEQSRIRLRNELPNSINVKFADDSIVYDRLNHRDILVVNWEKINTKKLNTETGKKEFDNKIMREGEKRNFPELLENTRNNDTKIILIIDESHNTASSDTSKELIGIIKPTFVLEMTATPNKATIPQNKKHHIQIDTQEVINEGIIKKEILINDFKATGDVGVNKAFINAGLQKRNEIKNEIDRLNLLGNEINYNPLALIQLPDGKEDVKTDVLNILKENNITIDNGKLAIWLSNDTINKENIEDLNSNVEVLIFKQAIATGWDCPRACVLIRLREVKSISFDIQTVGRILRMPERKHYNNKLLDSAYIFIETKDYKFDVTSYDHIIYKILKVKDEFIDIFNSLIFETYTNINPSLNIKDKDVSKSLSLKLEKEYLLNDSDIISEYSEGSISTEDTLKENSTMTVIKDMTTKLSDKEIGRVFDNLFESIDVRNAGSLKRGFINFFKAKYLIEENEEGIIIIQKSLINNVPVIENALREIKEEALKENKADYIKIKDEGLSFGVEAFSYVREDQLTTKYKKYAYDKAPISKYNTEKNFEKVLDRYEDMLFWFKNPDKGAGSLAIAYDKNGVNTLFHPDYICMLKDYSIAIFEVKGVEGSDIDNFSDEKERVLKQYLKKHNYKGSLVRVESFKDNDFYIDNFNLGKYL